MRMLHYTLLDVFTARPLEGNQLAVFSDGRGLSDDDMQRLARETNLSETTFIIPRDPALEEQEGVRVRIFTVVEELPFAGHPTLGTATVIRGQSRKPKVTLDMRAGKIPVTFEDATSGPAFAEMRQLDPTFGQAHRREDIAAIAGLEPADLRDDVPIQTVSTGVAFCIVPVKTLAKLQGIQFRAAAAAEYATRSDAKFIYFVTTDTGDPEIRLRARMMFYNGEDPATGSAAGCAAAWMAQNGVTKSNERVCIEQGAEIKRPSQLYVRAEKSGDAVTHVRVGGHAIEVGRGEFRWA